MGPAGGSASRPPLAAQPVVHPTFVYLATPLHQNNECTVARPDDDDDDADDDTWLRFRPSRGLLGDSCPRVCLPVRVALRAQRTNSLTPRTRQRTARETPLCVRHRGP